MNKNFYPIKSGPDWSKCPLCNSNLQSCGVGVFCSDDNCPYVDGHAWLTEEQAQKFKNLINK